MLAAFGSLSCPQALADPLDTRITLEMSARPLGEALRALAKQANLQILFAAELVAGHRIDSMSETVSIRAALAQLLRGSHLEALELSPGIVVIRRGKVGSPTPPATMAAANPKPIAPSSEPEPMGEILVTAERRVQRLQEVPISVSAYGRTAMEIQGSHSIDDIARLTPGVDFQRGTNYNSESTSISIRGISSVAGAATTGIYIDDTPIQSRQLSFGTFDAYPQLFDLDRVEVLRGPQGTLFGSGSEGGTIRFITPEPRLDQSALYARAESGGTEHGEPIAELGVAGGVPLIDDAVALRASLSYRYEGGYVDRVDWHTHQLTDPNSNASTTETARVAIKWMIDERLSVTPSFYYQYRHVDDTAAWWAPVPGTPDPTGDQFEAPFRNGNAIANPSTDTFALSALKLDWNPGSVRLLSNTSYFKRNQAAVTDYTEYDRAVFLGNPYPPPGAEAPTYWQDQQSNWTEELRLESSAGSARAKWTAGLFYQHAFESTVENVYDPALVSQLGFPVYKGGYLYYQEPFSALDRQIALFGQTDVRLSDLFNLTLGLRYGRAAYAGRAYYAGPVVGTPVSSSGSFTEYPVTPKVGLDYRVDAHTMVYVSVAKGYRIGGTNPAVGRFCYGGPQSALGSIGLTQVPPKYDADSVWSYEVGSKGSFAGGRALIDASAYIIKWNDIQQNVALNACGFQFTANLGEAQSRGFDLRAEFKLVDMLSVGGTVGVTDAFYSKTVKLAPTALAIVEEGDHITGSPWKIGLFGEANFPLLAYDGYARIDFQYAAKQTELVPGQDPLDGRYGRWFPSVPAQSYTFLRSGVRIGAYDFSIFVQNLIDTHPRLTVNQDVAAPTGGTPLLYVISWRPRTIGVTLTVHY
jgi:outer membrane receptor protein involved in Fe transport